MYSLYEDGVIKTAGGSGFQHPSLVQKFTDFSIVFSDLWIRLFLIFPRWRQVNHIRMIVQTAIQPFAGDDFPATINGLGIIVEPVLIVRRGEILGEARGRIIHNGPLPDHPGVGLDQQGLWHFGILANGKCHAEDGLRPDFGPGILVDDNRLLPLA